MPIDPLSDEILTFSQAARRLPRLRNDRPVSPATIWRWATVGLRGVKLETTKVGSVNCTSIEALRRFLDHLNGQPKPSAPAKQRNDSEADVEQKLSKRGYPSS
jgi:Protein of unknown function (DUF1580)